MKRSLYSAAFAVIALSSIAFVGSANAATATIGSQSASATQSTATSSFITTDASSTGVFTPSTSGSIADVQQSPFVNTSLDYSAVSNSSSAASGSAVYNIGAGVTSISVLWGSPDLFNSIIFYSGAAGSSGVGTGTVVATFTAASLSGVTLGAGYDLVTFDISGVGSVEFADSGQPAFEYADLKS